jgi:hypothetical protein
VAAEGADGKAKARISATAADAKIARQASDSLATPEGAKPGSRLARFFGRAVAAAPSAAEHAAGPSVVADGIAAAADSASASALGMSSDDWLKLGEVFDLTDANVMRANAAAAAPLHPEAMSLLATLAVDVGSVQLVSGAAGAPPLLFSSLAGVSAALHQFGAPRVCASVGVASLSADAAGVALLRTAPPRAATDAPDAPPPPVLALEFEKAPTDGHADTVVSLTTAPVHITADLVAVRGLTSFFAKPASVDTAALAQTVNDTVSDAAAAAAAAAEDGLKALQGRPLKMDLRLCISAPKILIPTPRGAGMLLDLGSLQLASEAAPARAARGTECFSLVMRDVSATFVPPGWHWELLDGAAAQPAGIGAGAAPLLSPTGLHAMLVRSSAPAPGRPALALSVDVRALTAEISPSSVSRLLAVLASLSPLWTREGAPWAVAQHEAPLWVLTRNGAAPGRLVWARRWGVLSGEYLYLLESRDTPATAKVVFVSLRTGMEAAPLPARVAAGQGGVFAVLPHGVAPSHAPSNSRATLLRGDDAASAATWLAQLRGVRKRRHAAMQRRHAAVSMHAPGGAALDGLEHLISDDDEAPEAFADASAAEAATASDSGADSADVEGDRFSDAASEVESDDSDSSASDSGAATGAADAASIETFVLMARLDTLTVSLAGAVPRSAKADASMPAAERGVVTLRMSGAAVRYGQRAHDMALAVRLQSLIVVDCLAPAPTGADEPYLLTSEAAAVADSFPHYMRRTATAPSAALNAAFEGVDAAPMRAGDTDAGAAEDADATALVRFSYRTWTENSPDYAGKACEITARLAAVALAVRRPTIAALAALPYDYARPAVPAPATPMVTAPPETDSELSPDGTSAVQATAAALVAWAAGHGPEEQAAPPALGGAPRVVMRVDVAMESALCQLLLEGK